MPNVSSCNRLPSWYFSLIIILLFIEYPTAIVAVGRQGHNNDEGETGSARKKQEEKERAGRAAYKNNKNDNGNIVRGTITREQRYRQRETRKFGGGRHRRLYGQKVSFVESGVGGAGANAFKDEGDSSYQMRATLYPAPTQAPVAVPTDQPTRINLQTYQPGNLTHFENGLLLSEGLSARIIARTGQPVRYVNGSLSEQVFHDNPDGADTFVDVRPENPGGWVYVSNAEVGSNNNDRGGVGAVTFNKDGNVVDYRMVLSNSNFNCGGGRTPWNTWISCEEDSNTGRVWQVDPMGIMPPQETVIGEGRGDYEAFAADVRDLDAPQFFVTEDNSEGALRRFRPFFSAIDWTFPWNMLHGEGTLDYLILVPSATSDTFGTYYWTDDRREASRNAADYYPNSEGIDIYGSTMYFVCKRVQWLFEVNLDSNTYTRSSTARGLFNNQPDGIRHILTESGELMLYFTEDGGLRNGIHARNPDGEYFTVCESMSYDNDETTGVSFSPDGKHLYFAYQYTGLLYDIWRTDGYPFHARRVDLKYHSLNRQQNSRKNRRKD